MKFVKRKIVKFPKRQITNELGQFEYLDYLAHNGNLRHCVKLNEIKNVLCNMEYKFK